MCSLCCRRGQRVERVISIIGKSGSLSSALKKSLSVDNQVTCYSKDQINMLDAKSVIDNVDHIKDSDVIIVCSGTINDSVRNMIDINASGPIQLLSELTDKKSTAQVILIGSHAATWTSWPGITMERLSYNVAKKFLVEFVTGLEHSELSNMKFTIYNVSKFQSSMSNDAGIPIEDVVDNISWIINQSNPPLIFESGKSR